VSLIAGSYAKGECEFIADFALLLPIIIFMKICDLPLDHREKLLEWVDPLFRPQGPGDMQAARGNMNLYLDTPIAERRANPGNDLLSQRLVKTIDGRPLDDNEAHSLTSALVVGGLDTGGFVDGLDGAFSSEHPDHRRQLINDPNLIPNAIEELLRRFSILTIARIVAKDMV
jgi:cytochrome P450